MVDKAYRYIWMRKKGGPGLIQMQEHRINMMGLRKELGITSLAAKIEIRVLQRIGHVLRMEDTRMTKRITLGWKPCTANPANRKSAQETMSYWRATLRDAGIDPEEAGVLAGVRTKWSHVVNERRRTIRAYEENEAGRHKDGNDPEYQINISRRSARREERTYEATPEGHVCRIDNCNRIFVKLIGLRVHQGRMHGTTRTREDRFECEKCLMSFNSAATKKNHTKICEASRTSGEAQSQRSTEERREATSHRRTCPHCNDEFSASNMARHKRKCAGVAGPGRSAIGEGAKPTCTCSKCGKNVSKTNISRHVNSCKANRVRPE